VNALLGPAEVRALAAELGIRPTKKLGQNFVHDPNTVRRIVRAAALTPTTWWWRSGPGSAR
jgi:16S rRNA (adenine1518-N6/adenine1519-N6)-dimethyltransferase